MATHVSEAAQENDDTARSRLWSRNGRKLACAPCRRRKLACDHGLPVCQRCQRAKTTSLCVYGTRPTEASEPKKKQRTSPPTLETSTGWTTPGLDTQVAEEQGSIKLSSARQTEYLGPTNITTLLRELDGHLQPSPGEATSTSGSPQIRPALASDSVESTSEHIIGLAIEVLQAVPDAQTSTALLQRCQSPVDGWVRPAVLHLSESLQDTFKPYGKTRNANLARMARALCGNMSKTIEQGRENAEEWLASISGSNFRWECVGILFAYWATGSMRQEDREEMEKIGSPGKYMNCMHQCIDLCGRRFGGNSLLVHLLLKASHLAGIQHGDVSLVADRLLAEAITVATNLGMHAPGRSKVTSFLTEVHRRVFAHVYIVDKNSAIFTGRPPHLSHRYCSLTLPLDLSDEIVMSLPGDLVPLQHAAPGKTDDRGWNTEGLLLRTTLTRARALIAHIRGEILEMALAVDQVLDAVVLRNLKQRQEDLFHQFPKSLHLEKVIVGDTFDMATQFAQLLTRLEHLQNLFFIHRLLVKAIPADPDSHAALARTSLDILTVVLNFWTHGTHGPSTLQVNYDWLIVAYACPSAGVLCGELLRRDGLVALGLRRSDVVHQLSLLSGFLTWIGPQAANAPLWGMVKDVIHRVLDQLLNEPPVREAPAVSGGTGLPDVEVPDDFHDWFACDLLDSFDWLRSDQAEGN